MPLPDIKIKHELYDFLSLRKAATHNNMMSSSNNFEGASDFTHTSIGEPKGSYYIDEQDIEKFWKIYHKAVFTDKIPIHLTERINNMIYTPLKIDLDFRYSLQSDKPKRIYSMEDIIKVCQLYMEAIDEYLEDLDDYEREFFIMQKPDASFYREKDDSIRKTEKGFVNKDGVHIVAPRIITTNILQHNFREYAFKNCGKILDKFNFENSYSDIFDRAVIDKNNWQMYGSSKPNHPAYLVSHIVRIWKDKYEIIENKYTNFELIKMFSMRRHDMGSPIKFSKRAEVEEQTLEILHKRQLRTIKASRKKLASRKLSDDELKIINQYIDCLSEDRAKSYQTWIEVGWCLHNIDDRLLNKWIEFSKKSPYHSNIAEQECMSKWNNMSDEGLGIGSLKMWAKNDNKELYQKVLQADLRSHIEMVGRLGKNAKPYDIAKLMYHMYHYYYVCVDVQHDRWYYYDENVHRWIVDMKGCQLRKNISTEVYMKFKELRDYYSDQSAEAGDDNHTKAESIGFVMGRLKDTAFKENIMMECRKELFNTNNKEFTTCLDSNNDLIGFKNGVFDLKNYQFRNGRPEDYISMSTGINYIDYDEHNSDIKAIMKFYSTVFVIKKVRDYIFKTTASFLGGSVRDEQFYIYSGSGGNGKSKHIELIESALGDYACKLPVTLLTMKRAASNVASPELFRTKGKRFATLQEPDTKTRINVGLMKELTGGDKIQARPLYGEPIEFKPQYKLALICNDKPEMPSHDDGTWRRVRNIEFISKFVHTPQLEKVLEFKMDLDLTEKIQYWAEPFMSILIHYYKRYRLEGVKNVPDEIIEYTTGYRSTNNHFQEFIDDVVDFNNTNPAPVFDLNAMHIIYKDWYKQIYNDNKDRKRKDLKNYLDDKLSGHLPIAQRKKIVGYKLHIKWKTFCSLGNINGDTYNEDAQSLESKDSSIRDELDN
jgi:P4 family phage/plasmid primase-like protien